MKAAFVDLFVNFLYSMTEKRTLHFGPLGWFLGRGYQFLK
jgi:hypothetical protein